MVSKYSINVEMEGKEAASVEERHLQNVLSLHTDTEAAAHSSLSYASYASASSRPPPTLRSSYASASSRPPPTLPSSSFSSIPSARTASLSSVAKKRVHNQELEEEKVFASKYAYEESLIPTALKEIPIPRDGVSERGEDCGAGGDGLTSRNNKCCSCGSAACGKLSDWENIHKKHKSRSLFFPEACETSAFSSTKDIVPNAMTKIDKISERLYSRLPELVIRRQSLGGCSPDCILCDEGIEKEKELPDSCRCFVHSLKGRSSYSVRNYGGEDGDEESGDPESLLYNNMSYSYFSSFWPNCRLCPTWAPCYCRPGAEGRRITTSSSDSHSDSTTESSVIPEETPKSETSSETPEPDEEGEVPVKRRESRKSVTQTMPEDEIEAKVDEIAAAVTSYAHEIFIMPELAAEIVEDLPDPKVFLTEDGQLRTRFSLTKDRIKIDELEVTETLASAVKSYVESFEEFCEFLEDLPSPQLFLDHDGIVRSGAELLANRKRIHQFIIERVTPVHVSRDFASTELINHKLKGMKLVQAVQGITPQLDELETEVFEEMDSKKIDPTGFMLETATFRDGRGGHEAPSIRLASDFQLHPLDIAGRFKTRFFRVTRGSLAEADHKWTPDQGDNIAFMLRYPDSGPREEDIMELLTKLQRTNEQEPAKWKVV